METPVFAHIYETGLIYQAKGIKMTKKILSIIAIIFITISFSSADDAASRGSKVLDDYYQRYDKTIDTLEGNFRILINSAFAACVLFDEGEQTAKADKILYDTLKSQGTYFSGRGSAGHNLYWETVILCRMVNAPEIMAKLSPQTEQAMKAVLWDFVYTFDKPGHSDPSLENINVIHNSDNHDMIHRGVYLMAAQALKNDPLWRDKEYADGSKAAQRYDVWRKNLMEYFRFRAKTGVNAEFGSCVYAGVHLHPIFNIYDYCEDEKLSAQAGKFLTLFFADVAQEVIAGVRGGAKVRMYKAANSYNYIPDKLLGYNHILTGQPAVMPVLAATDCFGATNTKYRLPDAVRELMTNTAAKGSYAYKSNRLAQGGHILGPEYDTGMRAPIYTAELQSGLMRYTYATPSYLLGTFTVDETKTYMLINSQNQWMALTTAALPSSRIVVNLTPTSDERTGYRELLAAQHQSCAMFRKQLAANDTGLMRLFVSDDLKMTPQDNILFFENDLVYVAVVCGHQKAKTDYTIEKTDLGPGRFITYNEPNVFIVLEVAAKADYAAFDAFKAEIAGNELKFENNDDEITYKSLKNECEIKMFTDIKTPLINGKPVDLRPKKVYNSPYLQSDYDSGIVQITGINGEKLVLDFNY